MAYDESLANQIRNYLKTSHHAFEEIKMMGGLCFKVDNKMLCGIHIDKMVKTNLLMLRVGETIAKEELTKPECLPMDFTGRPIKGYIFIKPEGFNTDTDLKYWLNLCLAFNPKAKASKSKKKK